MRVSHPAGWKQHRRVPCADCRARCAHGCAVGAASAARRGHCATTKPPTVGGEADGPHTALVAHQSRRHRQTVRVQHSRRAVHAGRGCVGAPGRVRHPHHPAGVDLGQGVYARAHARAHGKARAHTHTHSRSPEKRDSEAESCTEAICPEASQDAHACKHKTPTKRHGHGPTGAPVLGTHVPQHAHTRP